MSSHWWTRFYLRIVMDLAFYAVKWMTEWLLLTVVQLFVKFADVEEYLGSSSHRSLCLWIGAMEIQEIHCFWLHTLKRATLKLVLMIAKTVVLWYIKVLIRGLFGDRAWPSFCLIYTHLHPLLHNSHSSDLFPLVLWDIIKVNKVYGQDHEIS